MGWVGRIRATVRSNLWPLPTIFVVLAVAAGLLLPRADARVDSGLPRWLSDLTFGGDPGAARTVLNAVASSLITVTSLTFSLTVVTLQLASSQFSPRLLRTFTRDLFVQVTLALFLGTFAYSLSVLRAVRSAGDTGSSFVPRIAVTVAFVLALASVIALVLFLAHLARQIRVETMLQTVHKDASTTAGQLLGDADAWTTQPPIPSPAANEQAFAVTARYSGFLTHLDQNALRAAALACDAVVVIDRHPGSFIVAGTPIGRYWALADCEVDDDQREGVEDRIAAAVHTGPERTEMQDIGYGLRQLSDVTIKALSPGINDPTTALYALNHISALLCELARYHLGPVRVCDETDRVRVVLYRPDLADLADVALTQPRRYGAGDPMVLGRLFMLLGELAWCARPEDQGVIAAQLQRLTATAEAQDFDPTETAHLRGLAGHVEQAGIGRWQQPEWGRG